MQKSLWRLVPIALAGLLLGCPAEPDKVVTTYQWINFDASQGSAAQWHLYTGTSYALVGCTETSPDYLTITFTCDPKATGNTSITSYGCAILYVAAPGNVLNSHPRTETTCQQRTVRNQTIECVSQCARTHQFRITSTGP